MNSLFLNFSCFSSSLSFFFLPHMNFSFFLSSSPLVSFFLNSPCLFFPLCCSIDLLIAPESISLAFFSLFPLLLNNLYLANYSSVSFSSSSTTSCLFFSFLLLYFSCSLIHKSLPLLLLLLFLCLLFISFFLHILSHFFPYSISFFLSFSSFILINLFFCVFFIILFLFILIPCPPPHLHSVYLRVHMSTYLLISIFLYCGTIVVKEP